MKRIYISAMATGLLLLSFGAKAQLDSFSGGANVFMQGNHIELGVGHLGYFGSDTAAPAGYHPHLDGVENVGFVADPLLTGWDTSTTTTGSHYYGDYFLPGSPFEGWELQVGGMRVQAFNSGPTTAFQYYGGMPACTGANVSYTNSGGVITSTWQGTVDSITISQVTTLDTGALYFTVEVTLTNTSSSPVDSIYYLRSLDPDNDETWGGSFSTDNTAYNAGDTSVVTATGTVDFDAYMSLGTIHTDATAFVYQYWPLEDTIDLGAVYNETATTIYPIYSGPLNGDYAIGLDMLIPHLASVDSAGDSIYRTVATKRPANQYTLKYFYSFNSTATDQAMSSILASDSTTSSLSVNNVNTSAPITLYPNPSSDLIYVNGLNTGDRVTIYDMMGKQTAPSWTANAQGLNTFHYGNTTPAGGYIMIITDAGGNVKANIPVMKK